MPSRAVSQSSWQQQADRLKVSWYYIPKGLQSEMIRCIAVLSALTFLGYRSAQPMGLAGLAPPPLLVLVWYLNALAGGRRGEGLLCQVLDLSGFGTAGNISRY